MMLKPISAIGAYKVSRNIANTLPKQCKKDTYPTLKELPNYPVSFSSAQIQEYHKGSTPYVAHQLKQLEGPIDKKLDKAKDIILEDMDLPNDLLVVINQNLGRSCNAVYLNHAGIILIDAQKMHGPKCQFSDEAIMCVLRHELDHMEVFTKLYKKIGKRKFEKLLNPPEDTSSKKRPKINHGFYKRMSDYVNIDNFDADKYIDAIKNNYVRPLGKSYYRNFYIIARNYANLIEKSAREKQYELESLMGVTTLKDRYKTLDEAGKLTAEIKAKGIVDEDKIQERFDYLYTEALKATGLENAW